MFSHRLRFAWPRYIYILFKMFFFLSCKCIFLIFYLKKTFLTHTHTQRRLNISSLLRAHICCNRCHNRSVKTCFKHVKIQTKSADNLKEMLKIRSLFLYKSKELRNNLSICSQKKKTHGKRGTIHCFRQIVANLETNGG